MNHPETVSINKMAYAVYDKAMDKQADMSPIGDKFAIATNQIESAKEEVKTDIRKLAQGMDDLEGIDAKAHDLKRDAMRFRKDADELSKEMQA